MKRIKCIIGLSIFGTLFSGYLSWGKFFNGTCTLQNGGCSDFLGYPTCYYGFVMFILLLTFSALYKLKGRTQYLKALCRISFAGILFSAWFSFIEIIPMITEKVRYDLFFPSCSYGLIAYIAIFCIARKINKLSEEAGKEAEVKVEQNQDSE